MLLLGIHGKARSGKTTSADYLNSKGIYCTSFAKRVYMAVQTLFNLQPSELTDEHKTIKHPIWDLTLREMLILVGHDMARMCYRQDIWIKHVELELEAAIKNGIEVFVITDVRYDDEVEWLRSHNGILVHLQRDVGEYSDHITEKGIKSIPGDHIITNQNSIFDLYTEWDRYLLSLGIGK